MDLQAFLSRRQHAYQTEGQLSGFNGSAISEALQAVNPACSRAAVAWTDCTTTNWAHHGPVWLCLLDHITDMSGVVSGTLCFFILELRNGAMTWHMCC